MSEKRLAVIDGDLLAFRCAAVSEKRSVIATHNETLKIVEYPTVTEFKAWLAAQDEYSYEDFNVVPKRTPEPVEHALRAVKMSLETIVKNAKCDEYHIVMSGKDCFRLDLPLPTRYKASRGDVDRPVLLGDCREYLLKHHNAEVSEDVEADDILVGYMYQGYKDGEYIVQCSIDKDATHGPGWLFNWTTMEEPEFIDGYGALELIEKGSSKTVKGKGRSFLWYQILYGDVADSFKPCELAKVKFGEIGAYKLLGKCKTDTEALQVVVNQYKLWYPEPVTYKAWNGEVHTKNWLEIMQMYTDCAFMRRFEGDKLDMKKLLDKLEVVC